MSDNTVIIETVPRYFAGRRLMVGDQWREIGEEVPEAATWKHLRSWVNTGRIRVVEGLPPEPGEVRPLARIEPEALPEKPPDTDYVCDDCGRSFGSARGRAAHGRMKHAKPKG